MEEIYCSKTEHQLVGWIAFLDEESAGKIAIDCKIFLREHIVNNLFQNSYIFDIDENNLQQLNEYFGEIIYSCQ